MEKTRKGRLAKRAKSFKDDIIDILSNLRSPVNHHAAASPALANGKVKLLPVAKPSVLNGSEQNESRELLWLLENLPASITLSQHFTNEINKNIHQVSRGRGLFPFCVPRRPIVIRGLTWFLRLRTTGQTGAQVL